MAFVGCQPSVDEGIELPGAPVRFIRMGIPLCRHGSCALCGLQPRRLHLSGRRRVPSLLGFRTMASPAMRPSDTAFYPQAGNYEVTLLRLQCRRVRYSDGSPFPVANTVELPCEGTLALLTGCDNQKTWIFSGEAGAISVGPTPGAQNGTAVPSLDSFLSSTTTATSSPPMVFYTTTTMAGPSTLSKATWSTNSPYPTPSTTS